MRLAEAAKENPPGTSREGSNFDIRSVMLAGYRVNAGRKLSRPMRQVSIKRSV
jgi:hypothetical protein